MRPPMAYFGGKTTLGPQIAALLPSHDHYVEPYAGSLAVLLAKSPAPKETVNDLDHRLMTFWRVLRSRPEELARVCALTPHSRAEYLISQSIDVDSIDDELEAARIVWVCITQGRIGTLRKTGWRYYINPSGTSSGMPGYLAGYVDRMAAAAERLSNVSLECVPAIEVIKKYGKFPDSCLYVDPPYLGSTRSTTSGYATEMTEDVEHAELLAAVIECKSSVVLSGYASELYDTALAGWWRREIPTRTGQGGGNQARTEVIWSNRSLSEQLEFGESA
ncbi:D12 class N6 adenine-specific DNA methyltransferase [Mycobacteroides abscessus subsp. massiliense]|nr:D12 class N6 adenine-specific DNA methyltransferase [Mycobacteroides abscessus subsp. massiliense]